MEQQEERGGEKVGIRDRQYLNSLCLHSNEFEIEKRSVEEKV